MIYARALFEEDSKLKKKYPELTEPQSDLEDENDVEDFEDRYYEEKTKEFEAAWERGKKNMEDSQAPEEEFNAKKEKHVEKMKKLKEEYDNWVENRGNKGWTLPKGNKSADTLLKLIKKTDEMISKNKLKREDKEALKSIALSTSKTNYLDPRYPNFCDFEKVVSDQAAAGSPQHLASAGTSLSKSSSIDPCER